MMDEKNRHELILKRVNGHLTYNIIQCSAFCEDILSYLKMTPLLASLPFTKIMFEYKYSYDSHKVLGRTNMIGLIYINIINTLYTSNELSIDTVEYWDLKTLDELKEESAELVPILVFNSLMQTIIHESFHMHSADNYDKYLEDKDYNSQVEANVNYSCYKFIERNMDDLKYIMSKYTDDYNLIERLNDIELEIIQKNNTFLKEIKLNNPISIVCNLLDSILGDGMSDFIDAIREDLYAGYSFDIKIVYPNNDNFEDQYYIVYEGGLVNYIAIKYIINTMAYSTVSCSINDDDSDVIILTFEVKNKKLFRPALIPIMRKVDDDEFKSDK